MNASELKPYEGATVELEFIGGQRVLAKVLSVDPGSPGSEVCYDVLAVRDWGDVDPTSVDPNAASAVGAEEIQRIRPAAT